MQENNEGRWKRLKKGNVVLWNNRVWVVQHVETEKKKVFLISGEYSATSAVVTDVWPDNPDERLDSIRFIAHCVRDYLQRRLFGRIFYDFSSSGKDYNNGNGRKDRDQESDGEYVESSWERYR